MRFYGETRAGAAPAPYSFICLIVADSPSEKNGGLREQPGVSQLPVVFFSILSQQACPAASDQASVSKNPSCRHRSAFCRNFNRHDFLRLVQLRDDLLHLIDLRKHQKHLDLQKSVRKLHGAEALQSYL